MPDRAVGVLHRMRAEIDVRGGQFLDQRAERVGFGKPRDLVSKLEVVLPAGALAYPPWTVDNRPAVKLSNK